MHLEFIEMAAMAATLIMIGVFIGLIIGPDRPEPDAAAEPEPEPLRPIGRLRFYTGHDLTLRMKAMGITGLIHVGSGWRASWGEPYSMEADLPPPIADYLLQNTPPAFIGIDPGRPEGDMGAEAVIEPDGQGGIAVLEVRTLGQIGAEAQAAKAIGAAGLQISDIPRFGNEGERDQ